MLCLAERVNDILVKYLNINNINYCSTQIKNALLSRPSFRMRMQLVSLQLLPDAVQS